METLSRRKRCPSAHRVASLCVALRTCLIAELPCNVMKCLRKTMTSFQETDSVHQGKLHAYSFTIACMKRSWRCSLKHLKRSWMKRRVFTHSTSRDEKLETARQYKTFEMFLYFQNFTYPCKLFWTNIRYNTLLCLSVLLMWNIWDALEHPELCTSLWMNNLETIICFCSANDVETRSNFFRIM